MGAGKKWSKEELEFLEKNWGKYTIPYIAKKLNRTIKAVKMKAYRIGLGRHIHSGEYITVNQLMKALGRNGGTNHTIKHWTQKGLPVKTKRTLKKKFKIIYIEEFWKWAKKNRMLIDFSKVEENILGEEPAWVKEQRKADIAASRYKNTPWTKEEDSLLKSMLKLYRYSYRDISIRLRRTEGAIKRRMITLGIKERPLKADNHNPWSQEEIDILVEMYNKGYIAEVIAEKIPKSALAISGKIERMILEGKLKPRMECRKIS